MGKTSYDVRSVARLAALVGLLATNNTCASARNQLDTGIRMTSYHKTIYGLAYHIVRA